jgi:hypothetical protein
LIVSTTKRIRRNLVSRIGDDDDHVRLLMEYPKDALSNKFSIFTVERDAESIWRERGEAIVALWVHHSPGCLPWAWWAFTATEQRRVFGLYAPRYGAAARRFAYGLPRFEIRGAPQFETQHAYLARLGLLLDGERSPIREPHPAPARVEFWQSYCPGGA